MMLSLSVNDARRRTTLLMVLRGASVASVPAGGRPGPTPGTWSSRRSTVGDDASCGASACRRTKRTPAVPPVGVTAVLRSRASAPSAPSAAGGYVAPSGEGRIRKWPRAAPAPWPQALLGSITKARTSTVWGSATVSVGGSSALRCEATVADQPVARSLSIAALEAQPAGAPPSSLELADAPLAAAAQSRCRATFWAL